MNINPAAAKPHDRLAAALAEDLAAVNRLIRARMASEHAPSIAPDSLSGPLAPAQLACTCQTHLTFGPRCHFRA